MSQEITEVTRRAIFDYLSTSGINWSGRFCDDDFLSRLYDLTTLPSKDYRLSNAASDIHRHRVNNYDWEDDWVFYDSRFNLLHTSDEEFLKFLCETVHPVVRPNVAESQYLVEEYNKILKKDGWSLTEVDQISGNPIFTAQKIGSQQRIFKEPTG